MFFRLPVVRFFNRVINRATVTVALVLLQIGWLLWAFFSLTAGKVWVNAGLNVLSLFITLYLVRKDENSDYKIIWLVLIGMMPLLGGALYLAFGNKAPAKRMRQRMQAVERQHTADLAQQPGQTDALDPASRGLSRYVSEYGPYPAWKNSTAKRSLYTSTRKAHCRTWRNGAWASGQLFSSCMGGVWGISSR